MRKSCIIVFIFVCYTINLSAQYTMSNQTVYDCIGSLTDSEANAQNNGWYNNNESFSFVICPNGAYSITINFSSFLTEPINDYIMIYDGPNDTYPLLGGPFSGSNIPPQINSNGCVTITFNSDVNVTSEGFELNWEAQLIPPTPPNIILPITPNCSTNTITILLDQNIHCDSAMTSQILLDGQLNQSVISSPVNCLNDSTNLIDLNLIPGLNESGSYNIYFESYFNDQCNNIWDLSTNLQLSINDCPLEVELFTNNTEICLGECVDLYTNVSGGDSTSYNYNWNPIWQNSAGIQSVCPNITTQYIVTVNDNSPALAVSDTITIYVSDPPIIQAPFMICETDSALNLSAIPFGGIWSGPGITNSNNGTFNPNGLIANTYTVNYTLGVCNEDLDISILDIYAGPDISSCTNAMMFNLNSVLTTQGGIWSGCNCIQQNGDIFVGSNSNNISAIYTLANGCSDTLIVSVVDSLSIPTDTSLCQQSGTYSIDHLPENGIWSIAPNNNLVVGNCVNPIINFPYQQSWESGLNGWGHDPTNDFNWMINTGPTPSGNTGPNSAYDGNYYIYTEASNGNFPYKKAAIISSCINPSEYNSPVLNFWYHMYDNPNNNGIGQGSFSVDISVDNGLNWINDIWNKNGNQGNQWYEASIDLSNYNTAELRIRLRVITGNHWQSDVALDKLSILGGPVTIDGSFMTDIALTGIHNLIYTIVGCSDSLKINIEEINAGNDQIVCPLETPYTLSASPAGGLWNGINITNTSLGLYNPALNLGLDIITYSFNGCIDTAEILVIDTDIQIDTLRFCLNSGIQSLDMSIVPRTPWNGLWTGIGIINSNFPGEFNPNLAEVGFHTINYEANTCVDSFIISVLPKAILLDTFICSASSDIILNIYPPGGTWNGNGFINNLTGLFSPSQLGVGFHNVEYTAPNNCIDTFIIEIYNSPTLNISGLDDNYCFIDSNILITTTPNIGGVISGNGINGNLFNPYQAGGGYNNIILTYGSGSCLQSINKIVFVNDKLLIDVYSNSDSLCFGETTIIGANAVGGIGNYTFSWDNELSNSFEHIITPELSTNYIVSVSDGCSDPSKDTIKIFVHPRFEIEFTTSEKVCYGESGFAKAIINPEGDYNFLWDNIPSSNKDSIYSIANGDYQVIVTDNQTKCEIKDTTNIPGYKNIYADFSANQTECIPLLNANFQFIDNSLIDNTEISNNSYWNFGDNSTNKVYSINESPFYTYLDTGLFEVTLYLENIGGCKDSASQLICVIPEMKLYIPNSFTPNGDNCNDEFYIKGLGNFYYFDIKIYKRWGSEVIFESNEIIETDLLSEGNICNNNTNADTYFKMGTWDGTIEHGFKAPQGVYSYVVNYIHTNKSNIEILKGFILLIN